MREVRELREFVELVNVLGDVERYWENYEPQRKMQKENFRDY